MTKFLTTVYLKISSIGQFHDDTDTVFLLVKKRFFVANNVRVVQRRQYPNLVESIFNLLLAEIPRANLNGKIFTFLKA